MGCYSLQGGSPTTTTLSSSPAPSLLGQSVALTATVSSTSAGGVVTFYDGTTVLGSQKVTSGVSIFTTSLLAPGTRSLKAYYEGDQNDLPSTSSLLVQPVNTRPAVGFPAGPISNGTNGIGLAGPVAADFNNDGIPDLAVAGGGVAVLIGNGDGTFQAATSWATGVAASWLVTGDFNGDGNADLAMGGTYSGDITVLLGNGDGTFSISTVAGVAGESAVVADFNGDGKPDLALSETGALHVLPGNGDGTFGTATTITLSETTVGAPLAGDFNGDGKADIAVGDGASNLDIYLGNGDGTFQAVRAIPIASSSNDAPGFLTAGDFNGDGKLDIAFSIGGVWVGVMLGNGDGTFQVPTITEVGDFVGNLIAADFNGDWNLDLAVSFSSDQGFVVLLLGNGDGTLQPAVEYPNLSGGGPISAADFNRDGRLDIASSTLNYSTGSSLSVLLNQPTTYPPVTLTTSSNPAIASRNLTLTATVLPAGATGSVTFYNGPNSLGTAPISSGSASLTASLSAGTYTLTASYSGDATFLPSISAALAEAVTGSAASSITLVSGPNPGLLGHTVTLTATVPGTATGIVTFYAGSTVLGDARVLNGQAQFATALLPAGSTLVNAYYSGDSTFQAGLALPVSEAVQVLPSNAFLPPVGVAPISVASFALADMNNDGKVDFVSVDDSSDLDVVLGNGDGTFQPAIAYDNVAYGPLAVGDLNGDGRPDVVAIDPFRNYVAVLLGQGDGTLLPAIDYRVPELLNPAPSSVAIADFNGDGKPDLVVANGGSANVGIFLGNGDGTFGEPVFFGDGDTTVNRGINPANCSVIVADFNGDGHPDLAVVCGGSANIAILLGRGDGTFDPAQFVVTGGALAAGSLALGDFNGDGKVDLAALDYSSNSAVVILGNGDGTFQTPNRISFSSEYTLGGVSPLAVGDLNGDGFADIVTQDWILHGNGDGTFQPAVAVPGGYLLGSQIAVADLNRDGVSDLIAGGAVILGIPSDQTPVVVSSIPNPSNVGQSVTITATVSPSVATGTVSFSDGSGVIGTAPVVSGTATLTTSALPAGTLTLTATYNGGQGSVSAGSSVQTVLPACLPNPTGIVMGSLASSTALTLAAGSSCTWAAYASPYWITLVPQNGGYSVNLAANNSGVDRSATIAFEVSAQDPLEIPVTQAATPVVYADVPPSAFYFDAVNLLGEYKITSGCGTNSAGQPLFCPLGDISRSQTAIFLVRAVYGTNSFTASQTPYFADVPSTAFGFSYIQKLYELGITTGCGTDGNGNKLFCPDDSVTRAEMAVFLMRERYGSSTVFPQGQLPLFTDVGTGAFGYADIQRMKIDNITSGCGPTTYCPDSLVTRGEMAIFIMRSGFNQLLPPSQPILLSANPTVIPNGTTVAVTITGQDTYFLDGTTQINPVPGVTVASWTVNSQTSLTVNFTGAATMATPQPVSIWITTPYGDAVLPAGLMIE